MSRQKRSQLTEITNNSGNGISDNMWIFSCSLVSLAASEKVLLQLWEVQGGSRWWPWLSLPDAFGAPRMSSRSELPQPKKWGQVVILLETPPFPRIENTKYRSKLKSHW